MIEVVAFNPAWPEQFRRLSDPLLKAIGDISIGIEHVGSTAVSGMAAKPVIDIDIVIRSYDNLPEMIRRLAALGYEHIGNLGIPDREAFRHTRPAHPHNVYVCLEGSVALRNHLVFRDHLRCHPDDAAAYSELKTQLARVHTADSSRYTEGKTAFILSVLARCGLGDDEVREIRDANGQPDLK